MFALESRGFDWSITPIPVCDQHTVQKSVSLMVWGCINVSLCVTNSYDKDTISTKTYAKRFYNIHSHLDDVFREGLAYFSKTILNLILNSLLWGFVVKGSVILTLPCTWISQYLRCIPCFPVPTFPRIYVNLYLCFPIHMFPSIPVSSNYFLVPMFQNIYIFQLFPNTIVLCYLQYVSKYTCSPVSMFPNTISGMYVLKYLQSPVHILKHL